MDVLIARTCVKVQVLGRRGGHASIGRVDGHMEPHAARRQVEIDTLRAHELRMAC